MVTSTHTYSAVLIGSPDLPLKVTGGNLSLDATRAPHVQGTLTIAFPSLSTLNALDPRLTKRIRVSVAATFPSQSQTRTFDLALRDRRVSQDTATVDLTLASDEALLLDYAPLTDDITPRTHAASLRAAVNYVLNKAIPGKSLAASPALDADATRYWAVTNLITNPTLELDVVNWAQGTNSFGMDRIFMTTPTAHNGAYALGFSALGAGDTNVLPAETSVTTTTYRVTPGRWYVWSYYIVSNVARSARAAIQWWSADGTVLSSTSLGTATTTSTTAWQRRTVIAQAPEGASHGMPYVNTIGNAAGNLHYVDDAMFYEGDELIPEFNGNTTDTADYLYDWSATAHASTSTRTPISPVAKESLTWRSGQSALEFLRPLVQKPGFRLVCDEGRVWTLRDENYEATGTLSIRYGVNMIGADDNIQRDGKLWFDAAVTRYSWTDENGIQQERSDAYALTTPYTRLQTFDRETPYPGAGFSEYMVRRAQDRGREVTASAVADWRAKPEQQSVFVLNGAATQSGKSNSVRFDLGMDRMTINSRTTETGAGAIDLLSGTINGLAGTINGL